MPRLAVVVLCTVGVRPCLQSGRAGRSSARCARAPRGQVWCQCRSRPASSTHDGVTLYYEVYGAGNHLFMHRALQRQQHRPRWASRSIEFPQKLQGHRDGQPRSRSQRQPRQAHLREMTDDLAALLDHLEDGSRGRAGVE